MRKSYDKDKGYGHLDEYKEKLGYEAQESTQKPNNYSRRDFLAYATGVAAGLLFAGGYSGKAEADSSYFSLAGNLATGASEAIKPGEIYKFKVQPVIPEKNIVYGKTPIIAPIFKNDCTKSHN